MWTFVTQVTLNRVEGLSQSPNEIVLRQQGCFEYRTQSSSSCRTKHAKIDRHFIKEEIKNGSICISYVPMNQ